MPNEKFEKIVTEACRYLKSGELYTDKFKHGTPVQFVLESYVLLKELNLLPKPVRKIIKSDKYSTKFRMEGNNAFKQKNDMLSLKKYTKAIAAAPNSSKELALAYANRSAVTFSLEEYTDCMRDINRALEGEYPEKLKYKLLERKGKCLLKLNKEQEAHTVFFEALEHLSKSELETNKIAEIRKKLEALLNNHHIHPKLANYENNENVHDKLPKLSHPPSSYIQVASSAVDICFSNSMGRHVVANADLYPGDVLAVEKPYASVLLHQMYTSFCFMCKKRCHSLVPCLHCTEVLFCSEECRSKGWAQNHCIDCSLLPTLINMGCENIELIAVQILLVASKAGERLLELLQREKQLESSNNPNEKGFKNGLYLSDDCKSTWNLEMNESIRNISDMFRKSLMAASILCALDECTPFFKNFEKKSFDSPVYNVYCNEVPGYEGVTLAKAIVGAFILRFLMSVPCNAHEISEMQLEPKGDEYCSKSVEIGGAIYPFLSLINHSCDPNVVRYNYEGDYVILIVIKIIKRGEQIYDSYSNHYAMHDKDYRQTNLLSQYFFVCKCEACLYDWPLYKNQPENNPVYYEGADQEKVKTSSLKFKKFLKEINAGKPDEKLPFLYEHLILLHNNIKRPWKEFNQCQEAIKQCLSVKANHYIYKTATTD